MKLWVNVCFYYVPEKLENFKRIIKSLQSITTEKTKIIVNSNVNFNESLRIDVALLNDPYHLTWEHKKYMPAFLDSDYTHYVYMEGNVEVTEKNLVYWEQTRNLFLRNNLNFVPGLHRTENDAEGNIYSLDCTRHPINRPVVSVEGKKFISIGEPYHGMFIMDRNLVQEHINSEYFYLGQKGWYGIRESANLGNTYINVPQGFEHKVLIPIDNFSDCWIPHLTNNYVTNPNSPHSKIKIETLLNGY
jgi:hypothetical protein